MPLEPAAEKETTVFVQRRSRQMSTMAPSLPLASDHLKTGVCDVTVAVDRGATGRGGGTGPPSSQTPPTSVYPGLHAHAPPSWPDVTQDWFGGHAEEAPHRGQPPSCSTQVATPPPRQLTAPAMQAAHGEPSSASGASGTSAEPSWSSPPAGASMTPASAPLLGLASGLPFPSPLADPGASSPPHALADAHAASKTADEAHETETPRRRTAIDSPLNLTKASRGMRRGGPDVPAQTLTFALLRPDDVYEAAPRR